MDLSHRGRGRKQAERLRVMDWEHPENNDFLLVSQFSISGERLRLQS